MHSYQCHRYHLIFSTKNRVPFLTQDIEAEIWQFLIGTGRSKDIRMYAVGGVEDHLHLLVGVPAAKAVADAVMELKGTSSRWMKQRFGNPEMGWQTGYGSFTTMASAVDKTVHYIRRQRIQHQTETFDAEMSRIIALHERDEAFLL